MVHCPSQGDWPGGGGGRQSSNAQQISNQEIAPPFDSIKVVWVTNYCMQCITAKKCQKYSNVFKADRLLLP